MFIAESFSCGRTKMADISCAENVCLALGCRVEDRIVIRIELSQRFHDDGLNQVSDFRKIAGKAHDLIGGDPVSRLNARIQQNPLDLIENKPRQYQRMSAQDRIQDTESGPRGLITARTRMFESRVNLTGDGCGCRCMRH